MNRRSWERVLGPCLISPAASCKWCLFQAQQLVLQRQRDWWTLLGSGETRQWGVSVPPTWAPTVTVQCGWGRWGPLLGSCVALTIPSKAQCLHPGYMHALGRVPGDDLRHMSSLVVLGRRGIEEAGIFEKRWASLAVLSNRTFCIARNALILHVQYNSH